MSTQVKILAVVGCLLGGCDGTSAPEDFPRGCDQSTIDGDCIEYTGEAWTEVGVELQCTTGEIVDACPDGAVGTCAIDTDTIDGTVSYFYPQFWPGTQAAQKCISRGGIWTDA
ncbi:MAG: hypothetical protein AAGA48_22380 [Myxococcota bacterium]